MLKTIGYGRPAILLGFVIEAVFLTLIGGALGCMACAGYLWTYGNTKDMFGQNTFTVVSYQINLTPTLIAIAMGGVALVGVFGALFPAWRAARIDTITALRQA